MSCGMSGGIAGICSGIAAASDLRRSARGRVRTPGRRADSDHHRPQPAESQKLRQRRIALTAVPAGTLTHDPESWANRKIAAETRVEMTVTFWTAEKDKQLQRLEVAGLTAAQIADRIGNTRNAVIGRSVRLRGLIFPSQLRRQRREQALRAARLRQKKERMAAPLAAMRRAIARGTPRNAAIVSAVKAHVTYQAIADELGLSRQRVQQIVAGSHD